MPPRRWQSFLYDCARFLDSGWAEKAAALGWGPYDLFGSDRALRFAPSTNAGFYGFSMVTS
jgi:hypothetical protein